MTDHSHLWNKDLERAALAVVLDGRHKDAWGVLAQVLPHPGYFFQRDHQLIYLAMQALADRGVPIDSVAVCAECQATVWREALERLQWVRQLEDSGQVPTRALIKLPPPPDGLDYSDSLLAGIGGFNAITDLAGTFAAAASLERTCKLVADYYRTRRLFRAASDAVATLASPKGVKQFALVGAALINAASRELGQATADLSMAEAIDAAMAEGDAALGSGGAARAWWGLPTLDAKAPLTVDAFAVLAAAPGVGKTSLAMQALMETADRGGADSVALVSREMRAAELARIVISRRTGIPVASVRDGTLSRAERAEVEAEARRWRDSNAVAIQAYVEKVSVDDVCAWVRLRHLRAAGRLRLVVIDYLQLLDNPNARFNTTDALSYATRKLKILQGALNVPILLLSQMSRDGTKAGRSASGALGNAPEPQAADLRGSGSIEQDANLIVMLWPREPKAPTQRVTVKVEKNRAGDTGLIDCAFHRARGQVFKESQAEAASERAGRMQEEPSASEDLFHGG